MAASVRYGRREPRRPKNTPPPKTSFTNFIMPPSAEALLLLDEVLPQQIRGGDAPSRPGVHDPHLESVAVETEVLLDETNQPLHRRVGADSPPPPALAVCPCQALSQSILIGLYEETLQRSPVGSSQPLD